MLIKEILEATNGQLLSGNVEDDILFFTHDSREVKEGYMYIPIIGERVDGHQFIEQAFISGAKAILTDRVVDYKDKNVILVEDTRIALGQMGNYIRHNRNVKVVGITGSVGKTSTKDMIYSVISTQYKTLKTLGNFNSDIGLPLTILRHTDEEVMVLEMGMNHLEEIHYLSMIANPDVAAITNVGTAHIGELGSRENILKAKMEIKDGLNKDGYLVVNDDNDMLHSVEADTYKLKRIGKNDRCDLKAFNIQLGLEHSSFDIQYQGKTYNVYVPVSGEHFVYNALIALQIGLCLGIDIELCIKGVRQFELTKNRMDILDLNRNIKVIDGTYNANLDSMKSSIDVLANFPNRKIAVLADMLELGEYEEELHREVGKHIVSKNIDVLYCLGQASRYIAEEAKDYIKECYEFDSREDLSESLIHHIQDHDVILIKGSNGMKLKEVVEYLKENV